MQVVQSEKLQDFFPQVTFKWYGLNEWGNSGSGAVRGGGGRRETHSFLEKACQWAGYVHWVSYHGDGRKRMTYPSLWNG